MLSQLLSPLAAIVGGLHTHRETDHNGLRVAGLGLAALGVYVAYRVCAR